MPNFFSSPLIQQAPNYEPAGYDVLRNFLLNQIGGRSINPYGISPQGGQSNPYNPYGGRGQFDPYGGGGGYYNPQMGGMGGRGGMGRRGWGGQQPQLGGGGLPGGNPGPAQRGDVGGQQGGNQFGQSQMGGQPQGNSINAGSGGYTGAPQGPQGYSGGFGGAVNNPGMNMPGQQGGSGMAGGSDPMAQIMELMRRRRAGAMGGGTMGGGVGAPNSYDPYGGVGFSAYDTYQNQQNPMSAGGGQLSLPNPGSGSTPPGSRGFDGVEYSGLIQNDGIQGNPLPGGLPSTYGVGPIGNGGGPWGNGWGGPNGGPGGPYGPGANAPNAQTPSWASGGTGAPASSGMTPQGAVGLSQPTVTGGSPLNSSYDWQWHQNHPTQPPGGGGPPPGGGGPPPGGGGKQLQGNRMDGSVRFDGTQYSGLIQNDGQNAAADPGLLMKLLALLHLTQGGVPSSPKPAAPPPTPTPVPTPSDEQKREGQKGMNIDTITKRADDITEHDGSPALAEKASRGHIVPGDTSPQRGGSPAIAENEADSLEAYRKRTGQTAASLAKKEKEAKEDDTRYDAQPYPDESSPMPYDGNAVHIHAPAAPHIPHAGKSPLGGLLEGMASSNHRGQMAAARAGRSGMVYDATNPNASASPFPTGAQTAGGPMYPWMMSYQGNFTAPMSNAQNQGLGAAQNYVGSNPLGSAQNYNDQLLNGGFMGSADPYLNQIRQGMQGTKNQQDADAQQQIASAMAAGGNALSGARMAANAKYMDQSNNNFNTTMGNLEYGNLAREEALRNQGVGQSIGLGNAQMGMYGNLMGMGAVPQQTEQHDLNSQYNDWVRQIGAMQQGDQQNTSNAMRLLSINPQGHPAQYGTSQASGIGALLAGLLGGGSGGSGLFGNNGSLLSTNGSNGLLNQLFNSLFGGGDGSDPGGGTLSNATTPTNAYDPNGYGPSIPAGIDPNFSSNTDYGDFSSMWDQYFGGGNNGGYDPNDPSYSYT